MQKKKRNLSKEHKLKCISVFTKNSNTIHKSQTVQTQRFYLSTLNMSGLENLKNIYNFLLERFKVHLYPNT